MELITFIQHTNEGDTLEYKLNDQNKIYTLTNVTTHVGDEIYKLKETAKGAVNNKFKIEYSGNISSIVDDLEHNVVHYILLKEKENLRYLFSVESFRQMYILIN